jgi:hypothetical protein
MRLKWRNHTEIRDIFRNFIPSARWKNRAGFFQPLEKSFPTGGKLFARRAGYAEGGLGP